MKTHVKHYFRKHGTESVTDHDRGVPRPFSQRKGVSAYPVRTAILVPSTSTGQRHIGKDEYRRRIEETRRFLSRRKSGYTSVDAKGGYVLKEGKEKGEVIEEDVAVVESFKKRGDYARHRGQVEWFLKKKGQEWGQDDMGYEVEDDLYYLKVPPKKVA